MSDSEPVSPPLPVPLAELPAAPAAGAGRRWLLVTGLVAVAGLVLSILLWQKLGNIQEELARRSTDATAQSIEARTLARQAQEGTRELTARLALLETRLSEVSLQRTQLEELMQSLSRSRDENLVVDVESALRLAQQQAQLTGSAEPLLAALKSADQRLARAAQPRLNPLQRAIARDVERIKATTVTDVPGLLLKLDELTRMVDDLPLANAMVTGAAAARLVAAAPAPVRPASAAGTSMAWLDSLALRAWWQRTLQGTLDEARGLLRVSRIDQPDAALLAPEQAFFLRENLKLKLLNARLGLLSRQTASARSDLAAAGASLAKYFDPASRRTQAATQLLQQVQSQMKSSELPRLDETLAALATAAAGR
ncbi:MAG: uroporphyrinogen-III C-methyltransferase [Polaromonas sp.]|uniref:uroporphyrinogen-III C-methyltransferase n=1 Tax=Polaromonas sp. TaxID=1869339 RepID=UPI002487A1AE|nr:uroporphyrinogen-III C-methyltransferase [Polaromonas sp.]MDI1268688.1 uroporphyrinogen-III C-methyltransferase [Polaromonas sp.]